VGENKGAVQRMTTYMYRVDGVWMLSRHGYEHRQNSKPPLTSPYSVGTRCYDVSWVRILVKAQYKAMNIHQR